MDQWQVLVVEDDPATRQFLSTCVAQHSELALSAAVGSVADAMAWLDADGRQVDALLCDLGLPDGSGLDVIRHALQCNPLCEPLVISMFGDEVNVLASLEAGALGYIHKDAPPQDIAQCILDVRAGASPISPMIARGVLKRFKSWAAVAPSQEQAPAHVAAQASGLGERVSLTNRETTVLDLISRGFTYAEIAAMQTMSVRTVQTHIKNLYRKLAVHSKSEAVFEASRMGLL